ncbi:hypothetical protein K491DRAFT_655329 [Lophiostoma macrostomum CBS 122681]|uniref:Cytochrome P450 n=1 Tax=Lophiostoma macrostomum CBS 122681 TaxID=1314788 RepID=A0A6A6TE29_9PLEO|nr:hypothetical protein K491DRAFT_655329 [Lophiostoma macrostomum CBS 122681]
MTAEEQDKTRARLIQEAKKQADIIRYIPPGQSDRLQEDERAKARAEPNKRLIEFFGIDNVFTNTDDHAYRRKFVSMTIDKMRMATRSTKKGAGEDWTGLRGDALTHVDEYLRLHTTKVNLAELVQFVTLKISLEYLFEHAKVAMTRRLPQDVTYFGRRINELWLESKKSHGATPQWKNEIELHKALLAVTTMSGSIRVPGEFSDGPMDVGEDDEVDPLDPRRNPMNLLLPAYETMWRVVMRCVLEIQYRDSPDAAEWRSILLGYLQDLRSEDITTQEAFMKKSKNGIAPVDIAKEIMRLYPPSRRVHRLFAGEIVKAEIEQTRRSTLFGDNAAGLFDPKRWQAIHPGLREKAFRGESQAIAQQKFEEETLGFMPFAFVCTADNTATGRFGLKMVLLLTAAILSKLNDTKLNGTWQLDDAVDKLPPIGEPLRTDREAYGDLMLRGPPQETSGCGTQ